MGNVGGEVAVIASTGITIFVLAIYAVVIFWDVVEKWIKRKIDEK